MRKTDPLLKLRYANGLGDIITCVLHSRYIGHLTNFLTKNKKKCDACEKRAYALNILFPIRFWKLFFKTFEEKTKAMREDMADFGYVFFDEEQQELENNTTLKRRQVVYDIDTPPECIKYNGYFLSSKIEEQENNRVTVTLVFDKSIDNTIY